jgi:hypothetical protein
MGQYGIRSTILLRRAPAESSADNGVGSREYRSRERDL